VLGDTTDASQRKTVAANRGPPRVSVVIPVYNAGALLRGCLDSVLEQHVAHETFEVIAVDDGSTDDSGAVLDGYAAAHPNVHVVHQANSGGPGRPRNVGTDLARGDYVFYLDQDDMLGPEALRRMIEFADRHRSDVVLVRTQWLKDERPFRAPAMASRVDATLERAFRSLAPHKLLRRSFVHAAGLRFPEGRVPLEDGIVMARAYLLASRISTLGDDEHYYYRRADVQGGNLSRGRTEPDTYARSTATIMDIVRQLDPDPDRADRIVLGLYRRKGLKFFSPGRFDLYGPREQRRHVAAMQRLLTSHVPPALESQLPEPHRARSQALRRGDVDALIVLAGSTPWRSKQQWFRAGVSARLKRALRRVIGSWKS
jgi:glycosyltransferase involved in cell wall biosynthesis